MDGGWRWNDDALAVASQPQPRASAFGWNGQKFPGGYNPGGDAFIDDVLSMDYYALRQRSSDLFETNLYARGLIRRLVVNEVHTGLALQADPVAPILGMTDDQQEDWSDNTEAHFNLWASNPYVCDFEQRQEMTLGEMTSMARREALVAGDILVVLRTHKDTGLPTVQLVSGRLVTTPFGEHTDARIDHGVELDAVGKQVAYHVWDETAGEWKRIAAYGARSGQRTAWLMYGTDRRLGQVRGTPLLALVLQSLKEIDRYRDSAQRKAVINSILSMWIEKKEDKPGTRPVTRGAVRSGTVSSTDTDGGTRQWDAADQIPGMVLETLQQGEVPHAFKSDGGEAVNFPQFEAAILQSIAWANNMPAEILVLSFNSNYSASQAALNEFTMYMQVVRPQIARGFTQPIYEDWLVASVRSGTISAPGFAESVGRLSEFATYSAWTSAIWIGAVKPVTDILKLVKARVIMRDNGWTTNNLVSRELNGTKFSTNARHLRREREELPPVEDGETNDAIETVDDPSDGAN
jgi:lambda family phage portal protein